ncbi:MAG TPA: polyprenol monophosphomannose synthase [bacterium]|nr:polyprenol monophosphomannose synthase [bacterium]
MKPLVVIPTYNEKDNLPRIVPEVLAQDPSISVLVVDDNSPDGTGALADQLAAANPRVQVLHRPGKQGLGKAYLDGFRWALERDYDRIIEMDADFSHNPAYLPALLSASAEADVVLGSRYSSGVNVINWPMSRLLLSYFANVYARVITGMKVRDLTGGFKCFRRQVLETIDLAAVHSNGYAFQIEMSFRAHRRGFSIREIPIVFVDREHGHSKMSKAIVREAIWMVPKLRLMAIFGRLR